MDIALDWETFTKVCQAVREGQEITLRGVDLDNYDDKDTRLTIPASIIANLVLEGDDTEE